jgi:hypothetical protein
MKRYNLDGRFMFENPRGGWMLFADAQAELTRLGRTITALREKQKFAALRAWMTYRIRRPTFMGMLQAVVNYDRATREMGGA